MNHAFWAHDFPRLYIGIFEICFGIVLIASPQYFTNLQRRFRRELKDPVLGSRFLSVLQRRQSIEALPLMPWRVMGLFGIILGYLTAFAFVTPVVSYALFCFALSALTCVVFLRMRNRSERRAAMLTPRTATDTAPWWLYAAAVVSAMTPLPFLNVTGLSAPAAVVALVSAFSIVAAATVNGMAAILTGDDAAIEAIVERRMRTVRVATPLILATAVPVVFLAMGTSFLRGNASVLQNWAFAVSFGACFVSFAWLAACIARKQFARDRVLVV